MNKCSSIYNWIKQAVREKTYQRYAWALSISMLLHLALVNGFDLTLPSKQAISVVEVRLATAPKAEPSQEVAQKAVTPQAENTPPKPLPPESVPEVTEPVPHLPEQPVQEVPAEAVAQPQEAEPAQVLQEQVAQEQTEPVPEKPQEEATPAQPIPALALTESEPPYTYVSMEYVLLRGVNGAKIGQAKTTFEALPENRYILNSVAQPKGIATFFVDGDLTQNSAGEITPAGLKPSEYTYIFAKKIDKTKQAQFDWAAKQVKLRTAKGEAVAELAEGSQDLLSFMFQFMYTPPLQAMQVWIADGKRLRQYDYVFEGEETLKTEMGEIKTLHIANVKATSDEKTELWLALEYRNLPVKIRKTEKDGSVIEQVVTQLSTQIPR